MGFLGKLFGGGKGNSSDGDPQAALSQLVTLYDVPDVKADGGISPTSPQAAASNTTPRTPTTTNRIGRV